MLKTIREALENGNKDAVELVMSIIGRATIVELTDEEVALYLSLSRK